MVKRWSSPSKSWPRRNGLIENSLYMISSGLNDKLTYYLADIYAWNIDFYRLHKGDRFKVIYTEKFIDDTVSAGIERIKAAIFEHAGKGFTLSSFNWFTKRYCWIFMKKPKTWEELFSRHCNLASLLRYNLKRRIAYYGNRIKPHRGTDFAASVGTPILATANGVVVKSSYTRGNGNYVTIKHNNTYRTQYLHMKRRKVKVGEWVTQGQVIGWVGMTGYTSGPHVCYRFWKNGRQVDHLNKDSRSQAHFQQIKTTYLNDIVNLKTQLDCISFNSKSTYINSALAQSNSDIQ